MDGFVSGLALSGRFYQQVVALLLATALPSLPYSAALLGPGSEVLGYDTPLSTDHNWGPRLQLFLAERDHDTYRLRIVALLSDKLPRAFGGYSTHFGPPDKEAAGPVEHRVEVVTVGGFATVLLGFDPTGGLRLADWLVTPQQTLLELTAGAVYHDAQGALATLRASLAYYPHDVWLYLMAAQWRRIAQQEAFVGRTGDVGDEVGSTLVAANIVRDLMRLCFLIERRYAPYSKWLGTAFARLACGPTVGPLLRGVLLAPSWREREARLAVAYAAVTTLHNALGLTPPASAQVSPYYSRPYLVIHAERIADALVAAIGDPAVRTLPDCGALDQLSDSTDLLSYPAVCHRLRPLYE